ncbi:Uncharacterised protein [uncultured archaeon]|nr:Uncharacterised protein [uncultured archaeon]
MNKEIIHIKRGLTKDKIFRVYYHLLNINDKKIVYALKSTKTRDKPGV